MFEWTASANASVSNDASYVASFLPGWAKEMGAMCQLLPLILVPFVAIVQTCRYFMYGPSDVYERFRLLYRPSFSLTRDSPFRERMRENEVVLTNYSDSRSLSRRRRRARRSTTADEDDASSSDPPPKYTPPPSYSTATGARIARMLRQSFRRMRPRSEDDVEHERPSMATTTVTTTSSRPKDEPPPPDYATLVIETHRGNQESAASIQRSVDIAHRITIKNANIKNYCFSFSMSNASTAVVGGGAPSLVTTSDFQMTSLPTISSISTFVGTSSEFDQPRSLGNSLIRANSRTEIRSDDFEQQPPQSDIVWDATASAALPMDALDIDSEDNDSDSDESVLYVEPVNAIGGLDNPRPLNIVLPRGHTENGVRSEIVTIDIDTTTSVI